MGRPEPCVLFAQTFVHSQLDEYVDEVIFSEPIVITACEFLEQNSSSVSSVVQLIGATSPPSFALEVFVQCEGETRFRRLCQPFLYSHSSSNMLDVEAVVTSHLVVRGSYRSLSLVIYGNTAEDLGQFNIEFDLDSSLSNLVSSMEAKLDDLPPLLKLSNLTIDEFVSLPNALSLPVISSNISMETKQLLQLMFKILELSNPLDETYRIVSNIVSAASSFVTCDMQWTPVFQKQFLQDKCKGCVDESKRVLNDARKELLDLYKYKVLNSESQNASPRESEDCPFIEFEGDLATSKELMVMFNQYLNFGVNSSVVEHFHLSQSKNAILGLGVAFLLCSGRDSCFHFVDGGGMKKLARVFSEHSQNSAARTLMLLGVLERATHYSVGCEGFLGWWPREDEAVPSGISEGYSQLLKLLLQKQGHDVACLATYILHRLRFYEVVLRYECNVLSVLEGLSADGCITSITLNILNNAKFQIKKILNLINSRGPIEDPSPVACASRSLMLGQTEGLLSYKATSSLIASSNCCFLQFDIDSHLLELLKERGFLPLSAALLASSTFRTDVGLAMDIFVDIVSSFEAIILALTFCRSGLIFLLLHPEISTTLILALRGADDMNREECVPLRYASVLSSKGFFCDPHDVGMIVETHLRVVNAVDRLLTSSPDSEEFLWVLWELCGLSRFECGRQALLSLELFPEALSILIEALHSVKELESVTLNTGSSPLSLAIFHSAAEIVEVIVTDSTASSLASWIEHAMELYRALHSSSAGSNRKDAPSRLLEWIDAGVIYHKNGAIGVLRYAAVLASGGDPHLTSTSILVSDSMDVDNVDGESYGASDIHVVENLGKLVFEKSFDGITLRDSSVAQLTTSLRILAFISENSVVAASLYDEGATTIIYAVLVSCRFMLERSSNSYDYLVDEGTESNSTSDLLLERNREQSLIDLLVPCLVLVITILQKLQEANEQHRNTNLMNALLRLHREVCPRLAACAADMSSACPSALGFGAVCHLIVSALACWPIYGWIPGLFPSLLASVHVTSMLALGPKETCSFLCLLNDMLPEEGNLVWKNGMPLLSSFRTLAVGSLLGPQKERQINWYLEPGHVDVVLSQLASQLEKIAQIILHYAITSLVVIQDMLRVFIVRLAYQKAEFASVLLHPIILSIRDHLSYSSLSDTNCYKVYRLLDFLASLLEHPLSKPLLLKEGAVQVLVEVLERCINSTGCDGKQFPDDRSLEKSGFTQLSWSLSVFKSISLLCGHRSSGDTQIYDKQITESLSTKDCSLILNVLLRLCQVLPVGTELFSCVTALKDLGSCNEGRGALLTIFLPIGAARDETLESKGEKETDRDTYLFDEYEWSKTPPLLSCWIKLFSALESKDWLSSNTIDTVGALCLGVLRFCMDGKSLNSDMVAAVKCLFGFPYKVNGMGDFPEQNINYLRNMANLLRSKITDDGYSTSLKSYIYEVSESVKSLLLLMQEATGSVNVDAIISPNVVSSSPNDQLSSKIYWMADGTAEKVDDYSFLGTIGEKFSWECPEALPDRLSQATLPAKRKMSSLEGQNRRARGDNVSEMMVHNARGMSAPAVPAVPPRRDTFRQRKPNTSRPPSMHVDDYVARERNFDAASNSNVIAIQRAGSTGGRPPSIHVDEFMARQRERNNPIAVTAAETSVRVMSTPESNINLEVSKPKQLKPELDDELQGIDIVFDGEESDTDDKLPFPQPDVNLQQEPPVIVDQSSPHYIIEATQTDTRDCNKFSHTVTPPASIVDENDQNMFSSGIPVSHSEMSLARESSVSSENKLFEQPDDLKNTIPIVASGVMDSAVAMSSSSFPPSAYMVTPASAMPIQSPIVSRIAPSNNLYMNNLQQVGNLTSVTGSQGFYDKRFLPNQPPLPPLPHTAAISPVTSHSSPYLSPLSDVKLPPHTPFHVKQEYMCETSHSSTYVNSIVDTKPPTGFHVKQEYLSELNSNSPSSSSLHMPDSKYAKTSISSPIISTRPPPPPPTPPPYSSAQFNSFSLMTSIAHGSFYNQTIVGTADLPQSSSAPLSGSLGASTGRLATYPNPHLPFSRPASIALGIYGNSQMQQQGENFTNIVQNIPIPQSSLQSVQPLAQLQPLQPPQLVRTPQHPRPPIQASQQSEQGLSLLQNAVPLHMQPLQLLQQPQISPIPVYYQSQQPETLHAQQQQSVENVRPQLSRQQIDDASEQGDSGMSLQDYFSSPEAIQSLLSDREKLCQLLEQHPKLMQLLQEKLGQP